MRVLYLSWTGLAEPLGRSQVLAYLKLLSKNHSISLLTMEKPEDADDQQLMNSLEAICKQHNIRWARCRYHRRPRLFARAFDFSVFLTRSIAESIRFRPQLIHGRAYIASFVAAVVGRVVSVPFIFDMRALWAEELVVSGRVRAGSMLHKAIVSIEQDLLTRSAGTVSLTQAAVEYLTARDPSIAPARFVVIPTCADLTSFRPAEERRTGALNVIGSVGTVASGWFRLPWLMSFFSAAARSNPGLKFRIVSRDREDIIRDAARAAGLNGRDIEVFACKPEGVPLALQQLDALVMFFESGISKLASCPTRMAEALATGIPVIANEGIGDVADVVRKHRVGVLVSDDTREAMDLGVQQLSRLFEDPDLPERCRRTAEELFSVRKGAELYDQLYRRATARP